MTAVLLYPLLESPSKNHTPSAIRCGGASSPEANRKRQSSNTESNSIRQPRQQTTPRTPEAPKTQKPRKCTASVVSDEETLAIAATLRPAPTRTPWFASAATTSTARPSLPTRPVRPLTTGSNRNRRRPVSSVEVWLIRRFFSLVLKV